MNTVAPVRLERTIPAGRETVFRLWTTPEHIKAWYGLRDDWETPVAEVDLRVGGRYRIGLTPPGQDTFYEVGEYTVVQAPWRLVYTCRFAREDGTFLDNVDTVVTVDFVEEGSGTRIVLVQEGYPDEAQRDLHQRGWGGFLDRLERVVAAV